MFKIYASRRAASVRQRTKLHCRSLAGPHPQTALAVFRQQGRRTLSSLTLRVSQSVRCQFCDHHAMTLAAPSAPAAVLVVCLCAEWCGVCRDYRQRFAQVQAQFPAVRFLWIDVEDEADLLDPLDVDDFPTLLLVVGDTPYFFGPLTPQADTLARLLRSLIEGSGTPALTDPPLAALVARIRAARPA